MKGMLTIIGIILMVVIGVSVFKANWAAPKASDIERGIITEKIIPETIITENIITEELG